MLCNREEIGPIISAAPGLVDVVRVDGEPATVRPGELDAVQRLVEGLRETGAVPTPMDLPVVGATVEVVSGPFRGLVGTLVEERGRSRVAVRLTAIRQAMSVELGREHVRPAN